MSETIPEKETGRLEAFSDGVFAVAITLLALELKVPHLENEVTAQKLADALLQLWPAYLAFATSFFTVLLMWVHHHLIFKLVRRSDVRLQLANGFLLMIITMVPFTTAVVAEYWRTPAAATASAFYAGTFVLVAIAFYAVLLAGFRESALDPNASPATVARLRRDYRWGPPLYLAATVAGPFSPLLSMTICTGLWIFWALTTRDC